MFSKQRAFLDNASHTGAKKVLWVIILLLITQFNVFSEEKIGHLKTASNSEKETADSAIIIDERDDFERELIVVDSIIENTDSTMYALTKAANDSVKIDD